jgi:hypothetical protein
VTNNLESRGCCLNAKMSRSIQVTYLSPVILEGGVAVVVGGVRCRRLEDKKIEGVRGCSGRVRNEDWNLT